ncbi:1-aminocyclopropane-1-carboxylate synthase 3 [Dorcoceras hygrometricum]|uniref:1-aminocyclopropane-1-carboxylate synthase 3 n=1 Tax=Dorcoceras hygrometricum TaxID=472368 RepID=A0A2Z7CFQ4_9LAMI|nr:1-aminocyclopropane-1-carboxylate synthase 3 [Dorcoceras hygrometricum]
MQHAILKVMKCMMAIKRIVRTENRKLMQASAATDNKKLRCYYEVQYLGFLKIKILEHQRQIWKVSLEDESLSLAPGELISSTNTHQPQLCVTHLFYAYVRKATNTEFNVFVLGRDLILVCDSLAKQLRTSLKICE